MTETENLNLVLYGIPASMIVGFIICTLLLINEGQPATAQRIASLQSCERESLRSRVAGRKGLVITNGAVNEIINDCAQISREASIASAQKAALGLAENETARGN